MTKHNLCTGPQQNPLTIFTLQKRMESTFDEEPFYSRNRDVLLNNRDHDGYGYSSNSFNNNNSVVLEPPGGGGSSSTRTDKNNTNSDHILAVLEESTIASNTTIRSKGITPPDTTKPTKRKRESTLRKAPGAPKRFKSSYILFFMAHRDEIKNELGANASVSGCLLVLFLR